MGGAGPRGVARASAGAADHPGKIREPLPVLVVAHRDRELDVGDDIAEALEETLGDGVVGGDDDELVEHRVVDQSGERLPVLCPGEACAAVARSASPRCSKAAKYPGVDA